MNWWLFFATAAVCANMVSSLDVAISAYEVSTGGQVQGGAHKWSEWEENAAVAEGGS